MEEAAAADYMQADFGPGTGRLPHSQPYVTRSACPPRAPSPRAALSPRVRTGRDRRERSPPEVAAVPPRARATRRARTARTRTWARCRRPSRT
eukprot:723192-Prymnesium_polylepis.1